MWCNIYHICYIYNRNIYIYIYIYIVAGLLVTRGCYKCFLALAISVLRMGQSDYGIDWENIKNGIDKKLKKKKA